MPGFGGTQRGLTLGQATGGRPQRVAGVGRRGARAGGPVPPVGRRQAPMPMRGRPGSLGMVGGNMAGRFPPMGKPGFGTMMGQMPPQWGGFQQRPNQFGIGGGADKPGKGM